ncbi:MAG: hypothetical protein H7257_07890 [Taibaiella sp.]|nr:hypothetical protein [Taibaiella sp.]
MATKHTLKNDSAEFTIKHRAVCDEGDYTGPWRANLDQAYQDADAHQSQPGHALHKVQIITQQTLAMEFKPQ